MPALFFRRTIRCMITVYGIPNCDTVKKARTWLSERQLSHDFHDFKKHGVPADKLALWVQDAGRDEVLNRKGTTWRKLGQALQASVIDDEVAIALMVAHPSLIKRPIVQWRDHITVGFDPAAWTAQRAD